MNFRRRKGKDSRSITPQTKETLMKDQLDNYALKNSIFYLNDVT